MGMAGLLLEEFKFHSLFKNSSSITHADCVLNMAAPIGDTTVQTACYLPPRRSHTELTPLWSHATVVKTRVLRSRLVVITLASR
jgi:hypothetical protein